MSPASTRWASAEPSNFGSSTSAYVEDGAWNDPEYLENLRDAQKVTLAEGGSETIALKLVVPK